MMAYTRLCNKTIWQNEAFGKVFTKENLSDIPEARWVCPDKGGTGLCDISFDEVSVLKSLEKL